MEITVKDNQTILDLAVQYYGNIEAVGELLHNNPQVANDKAAVVLEGYEPGDFWPHIKLKPGQVIRIDTDSRLMKKNVTGKITKNVTTYIPEQWQEQLNRLKRQ